jgi:sulfur-oxidizing protein SoxY
LRRIAIYVPVFEDRSPWRVDQDTALPRCRVDEEAEETGMAGSGGGGSGRREMIALTAATAMLSVLPARAEEALRPRTRAAVQGIVGDRTVREGGITLRLPAIAENGNSVPLAISVDSPMTESDHVTAVHVLADANPLAEVATFRFTPACGRAEASTRIRLGETQDLVAIAELSDGSVRLARQEVKVAIGGCGG